MNSGFITEMKDKNGDSWYHQIVLETKDEEIEILNTNLEVAKEDLTRIAQLLDLEEGCTIYDIEDKIERLNNIIEKTESMLKRLMEEQEYCYKKYPENWEERTGVSNTWLTSRDCYWSALNYLIELKGNDKK